MQNLKLPMVALAALFFGCAGPDWSQARVQEIRFRDGVPGNQIAAIVDAAQIEVVRSAFQRSTRAQPSEADRKRLWSSMCFDVLGERPIKGRWLYEPDTGMFSRMDPLMQPVFLMTSEDKLRLNALFPKKG